MRYAHMNIVAEDWRAVSNFYQQVFDCKPTGSSRDLSGEWIEKLTGIEGVHIVGEHLSMPGYGGHEGPTLEIFSYSTTLPVEKQINNFGFGHIAFEVDDVKAAVESLLAHGGSLLGDIVTRGYGEMGLATFVYARDIEGNIVEIQSWKR